MNKNTKPTEAELEILNILWEKGASTVRQVHETLEQNKESGYTTTLKLMQIMFEKGLLKRDASSKTHTYEALVTRAQTQGQMIQRMVDTMFKGSAAQLVMQALGNYKADEDELSQIREYLDRIEQEQKTKKAS
ncbi:BlaI/MecI/CopY family transcriptional regulator [Taibaiella soli]|uniref:BlaI/MecI/CopY family transcriptional regulator n=1 Tax=Taibaiella soli TaxID=1649169 RepID=A0A2W2AG09_9BACT|nr:BlaI/MecI/CopY family transcriptional regulator [Taibaiella soli]PZF74241.1 BlaI/MecI/CopY family transcriptional regulator [Taibaiella soli]